MINKLTIKEAVEILKLRKYEVSEIISFKEYGKNTTLIADEIEYTFYFAMEGFEDFNGGFWTLVGVYELNPFKMCHGNKLTIKDYEDYIS